MASKNIEDSQEHREGKAIGQASGDQNIPDGTHGSHEPKKHPVDLHIPNQEQSSATNQRQSTDNNSRAE